MRRVLSGAFVTIHGASMASGLMTRPAANAEKTMTSDWPLYRWITFLPADDRLLRASVIVFEHDPDAPARAALLEWGKRWAKATGGHVGTRNEVIHLSDDWGKPATLVVVAADEHESSLENAAFMAHMAKPLGFEHVMLSQLGSHLHSSLRGVAAKVDGIFLGQTFGELLHPLRLAISNNGAIQSDYADILAACRNRTGRVLSPRLDGCVTPVSEWPEPTSAITVHFASPHEDSLSLKDQVQDLLRNFTDGRQLDVVWVNAPGSANCPVDLQIATYVDRVDQTPDQFPAPSDLVTWSWSAKEGMTDMTLSPDEWLGFARLAIHEEQ